MHDARLEQLLAKQEIAERLHDYVRAMDRMDDALGCSVFHPDAPADYGAMYRGTGHGFVEFVHGSHEQLLAHTHQLGSMSIAVAGERAVSETYVTVTLRGRAPDGSLFDIRSCGRYLDRWEQRDGRWRVAAGQASAAWVAFSQPRVPSGTRRQLGSDLIAIECPSARSMRRPRSMPANEKEFRAFTASTWRPGGNRGDG